MQQGATVQHGHARQLPEHAAIMKQEAAPLGPPVLTLADTSTMGSLSTAVDASLCLCWRPVMPLGQQQAVCYCSHMAVIRHILASIKSWQGGTDAT